MNGLQEGDGIVKVYALIATALVTAGAAAVVAVVLASVKVGEMLAETKIRIDADDA